MASDVVIITADELLTYPGVTATGVTDSDDLGDLVYWTNQLVGGEWRTPIDPVPFWVKNIAFKAAARALANPKGLASWTRSVDDASRTERAATAVEAGLYLTDGENARLRGRGRRARMGTIRLGVGWGPR